jgi:hypothetical protein
MKQNQVKTARSDFDSNVHLAVSTLTPNFFQMLYKNKIGVSFESNTPVLIMASKLNSIITSSAQQVRPSAILCALITRNYNN